MFAARIITSALALTSACTLADEYENLSHVESEGKRVVSATTTGPTCSATVDLTSDPANCGTCGNVCGSGLCYAGVCADATAGHVFAIGHGYATSNAALDRVLGNAVFMTERNPVRLLAYAGTAPAGLVTGTNAAIDRVAAARGRTLQRTTITSSADVATNIGNADVFLVYAQPQQSDTYLGFLGDEWSLRLDNFARGGGTVIVLDTASTNGGTAKVLVQSGLMNLTGRTAVSGNAYVGVAEDVAAARVPLMFGISNSVGWAPSGWSNVATSDSGQAIVVHRAIQ